MEDRQDYRVQMHGGSGAFLKAAHFGVVSAFLVAGFLGTGLPTADAETGGYSCRVDIGSSSFSYGSCDVIETDSEIAFNWPSARAQAYRGRLRLDGEEGVATALWNGFGAGPYIDQELGEVRLEDGCWQRDEPRVLICIYEPFVEVDEPAGAAYATGEEEEEGYSVAEAPQGEAVTAPYNRSSFRGLFVGMPVASVAASVDSEFTISTSSSGHQLSQFAEMARGWQGGQSLFISKSGMNCGQIQHDGSEVTQLTLYQCFFNLTGNITALEFARQVIDRYSIPDGMQGRQQLLGDGAYRFRYTEYTGHTENERFVVSHHEMFNRVELAITPVSQARF